MGSLLHIPTPFQVLTLTREIETATVSTWDNDPALKASGSLGVVTREIEYPQPGGEARDYGGKADLPALAVRCRWAGLAKAAVATWAIHFVATVTAVDEDASSKAALKACSDVLTVGCLSLVLNVMTQENTWIASELPVLLGHYPGDGELGDPGDPEPRPNKPDRFEAEAQVPLTVLWTREVMS